MPMLTKDDIRAAMYLRFIEIDGLTDLNATSLDIRIDKLLTPAMKRKDMKEVPVGDDGCWTLKPGDFYLYETVEKLKLKPGFIGHINSRSSWARYGVASAEADDDFSLLSRTGFSGKIICRLNSLGTTVKIRPGDAIAQAHLAYEHFKPVPDKELEWLIEQGLLEITKGEKQTKKLIQPYMVKGRLVVGDKSVKGRRMNGGFTLTTDPIIKVYTGKTIDPRNMDPDCFYEKRLANQGTEIPAGTFFLSASAEAVKIDRHFAGWVHEWNHLFVTSGYHGPGIHPDERASSLQTHASAPKIDPFPRFHGKITFENYANSDVVVKPGSRITELYLFRLNNPYYSEQEEVSRFRGQDQATQGKAHLDYKGQQLEFKFDK